MEFAGPYFPLGRSTNGRNISPREMVVALLIYGSGDEFQRHQAELCQMSQSSICKSVETALNVLSEVLVPKYNVLPTKEEALEEARLLSARSNFPPIGWGAIDGTHICVGFISCSAKIRNYQVCTIPG